MLKHYEKNLRYVCKGGGSFKYGMRVMSHKNDEKLVVFESHRMLVFREMKVTQE